MFYGAGAGGPETSSAVLGDLVSAARQPRDRWSRPRGPPLVGSPVLPGVVTSRYQISLTARDEPGVLATVAPASWPSTARQRSRPSSRHRASQRRARKPPPLR